MRTALGAGRSPRLLQLCAAPRAAAALPSSASAASGPSPDAAAAAGETGLGRTRRELRGGAPPGWAGPGGAARHTCPWSPLPRASRFRLLCPRFLLLRILVPPHLFPQRSFLFLVHFPSIQFLHSLLRRTGLETLPFTLKFW